MKVKKQFHWFTYFGYEEEQDYLRKMHNAGWKFIRVTKLGIYHFEKCDPQDVIYQLDFNQDGLAHKEEYLKMFNDCGWEYIQNYAGYSYFRKAVTEGSAGEEIFCDDESKSKMMQRVIKGRVLPAWVAFCLCDLPALYLNLIAHNYTLGAFFAVMFAIFSVLFAICCVKYARYKNKHKK